MIFDVTVVNAGHHKPHSFKRVNWIDKLTAPLNGHSSLSSSPAAAKLLQLCPTLCDPRRQLTRLLCPWDSPGKNTGVGCDFLLQCMKVKSESDAAQLCPTLSDSMDCSLPGSSVHGIFQARVLEWGAIAFSTSSPRIFLFQDTTIWN